MPLSLKSKFTLTVSLVVLVVVTLVSSLYLIRLTRQVVRQADDRAGFIAQQVLFVSQEALADAAVRGDAPASGNAADLRAYVQRALDSSSALNVLMESAVAYSPTIYEISVTDHDGVTLVSSDPKMRGRTASAHPNIGTLVHAGFIAQLRALYGTPRIYEEELPFTVGKQPFGIIRVGVSSSLLRDQVSPGLTAAGWVALAAVVLAMLLAIGLSRVALAPLERISAQLDKISAGQFDLEPVARLDELGQVSTKISRIGQQLKDVREIFSTLRENMNHLLSGLEDGLLMFNAEGRAVLVSPSAEKFLDSPAGALLGKRVSEVFPEGHSLRQVLRIEGDKIGAVEAAEGRVDASAGPRRVSVSVQPVNEQAEPMGSLVTLRDLDSLESIGTQLIVSERLAALGRVTAGVAHEVKNPLNSMRVWLEVLKGNMPSEPESQQAASMLDNEIDRLDRAVKTFLDYARPVELQFEEADLVALLQEVVESARPAVEREGVELLVELPPEFPSVRLDRQLIHQVVLNLVLNACEATPPGGKINVALHKNGEMAQIRVSDSGRGISPENQRKIFQLFFTTRPGGTGLGLANAFRFVQLHNGSIEFESEAGRGTTFWIDLPLAHPAEPLPEGTRDYRQPFARQT